MIAVNQKVKTPLGEGYVQGRFSILDPKTDALIAGGIAVRLPINDVTRACLKNSNCLTTQAKRSGVWVFQESELQ